MGARIDIGIDAQGRRCLYTAGSCDLRQHFAFFFRFQIKLADSSLETERQLLAAFANPGEYNIFRLHSGRKCSLQFAA